MNQEIRISHLPAMANPTDHEHSRHVETVELKDLEQFGQAICDYNGWAPSVFKDGTRNNDSFIFTQIMGLDVDSGLPLTEAIEMFKDYKHVIATTKSHQKEKTTSTGEVKPACDRYRVILFLEAPIEDKQIYLNTWFSLFEKYSFIDKACKDPARFYSKSNTVVSIQKEGTLIPVVKDSPKKVRFAKKAIAKPSLTLAVVRDNTATKGKLSLTTKDFIEQGAKEGAWNASLFKAAKDMQEQNYTPEEAIKMFESMTNHHFSGSLDTKDLATIESAFKVEPKYAPRVSFPVLKTNASGQPYPDSNHPDNMKFLISGLMKLKPALNELKNRIYLGSQPFNDFDLSNVRLRARETGISPSKDFIEDVLSELARTNSFHPFKQAVESTPWDGQDHIQALFNTITIEDEHLPNKKLYQEFLKRWLIGVVAKTYRPGEQNLVLVLKGGQGKGKSRWISKFNIAPDTFAEGSLDPANKDHELRHLNYSIWHASELDGITRKRDQAALKDFLTKADVAVREAYGRFDRVGKSVLSFCASVNEDNFLVDLSGNRRFLVLPVKDIDPNHTISLQQVFAQAKALFEQGHPWWFDNTEIQTINSINEEYLYQGRVDYLASMIEAGQEWTSGQSIFESLDSGFKYIQADLTKLGMLLKKKGIASTRKTINGVKMTVYQVKKPLPVGLQSF